MFAEPTKEQRETMSAEELDVRGAMELLGFNDEDTGGGVRCWISPPEDAAVQSTETDATPVRWDESVRYVPAHGAPEQQFPTLRACYEYLAAR